MQPTTIEALVIVALILSPGYVFAQIARRFIAHVPESTDVRFLLTIITLGTLIQAVAFPFWTSRIVDFYLNDQIRRHDGEVFVWSVVVCFVLPLALGLLIGSLTLWTPVDAVLDKIGLGYVARMPSAWDYIVREPRGSYVRVHFKDGRQPIGGVFGERSVASLDPKRTDLYFLPGSLATRQRWQLSGAHPRHQRRMGCPRRAGVRRIP
jgi:hypothetical protein